MADPESVFIYRTVEGGGSKRGIEVIDGYVYNAWCWLTEDEFSGESSFSYHTSRADMLNSPTPWVDNYYGPSHSDKFFGSTANDGEFVYYVNTGIGSWPDWTIGESDFYVLNTDTSYNFDDKWDGQPAIGIDIVNDHLAAIGFKHGFSILDIDDLSDIHEVAYYMDPDTEFYCTHFAMKDTVLYAVAHPAVGGCRLYMFHVADSVASGQAEADIPWKPDDMRLRSYPNPFNSSVRFAVEGSGVCDTPLRVEIFDVAGRKIAQLPVGATFFADTETRARDGVKPSPTEKAVVWHPDETLPSGVYLVRARAG
ncbi:MAG: T9SS type A sorting domain-containing protein, partial [bacterium]